jgi:glycine betaine/proline transport system ATP-binding protein
MTNAAISIQNLIKIFGTDPDWALSKLQHGWTRQQLLDHGYLVAVNQVSLEIMSGHIHVIMGLSGSGKSTLLRHLNGLTKPNWGEIYVNHNNLLTMNKKQIQTLRQQQVTMVFQNFALFPHLTVQQNVEFGVDNKNSNDAKVWIERVGLAEYANYYPDQLSGGMQQRVGLARALVTNADIVLMDEAFSALDPVIRREMQDVLLELQKELNKTIVFITHDLNEALKLGDVITVLKDGEVVQHGTPQQIVMSPVDSYVARFVKDYNRAQIVRCCDLMQPGAANNGISVLSDMCLSQAIQILGRSCVDQADVVDRAGLQLGIISLSQMVEFL